MQKNHRKFFPLEIYTLILFILGVFFYIVANFLWDYIYQFQNNTLDFWIIFYGWIGIIVIVLVFKSWNKITGFYFSPYTIFYAFMIIFNYGQFLMWSLGIHYEGELGATTFIRYMDEVSLLRIEMISLVCFIFFHLGALLLTNIKGKKLVLNSFNEDAFFKAMRIVSPIILACSFPVVIYDALINLNIALSSGYSSIYYGSDQSSLNPILKYISYMFFPSLIGTWIGYKFSKKSFYAIGFIFLIYMVVNLLAGDRGSWIYYLVILFWCYINFIKKPKFRTIFKAILVFAVVISVTSVFVKFREIGFTNITGTEIKEVLGDTQYIFIKPFFEMGQSARVLGIIIQDNLNETWQYGNSYIAALFSMILPRNKVWFGYPDFYLDNWLSQSYLSLDSYGVGFSIIAEAYLNGGVAWSPFIMMLLGMLIGKTLTIKRDDLLKPDRLFFVLSSLSILAAITRSSVELSLRKWFFGVLILLVLYNLFMSLVNTKSYGIKRREENE
jgi:oligosaccharide repeat unit polymerase